MSAHQLNLRTRRKLPIGSLTSKRSAPDQPLPEEDGRGRPRSLALVQRSTFPFGASSGTGPSGGRPLLYATPSQWPVDDVQMFADFFEKYYPPGVAVWRRITYIRRLMDFAPSAGGVLERARRTIGLTHLAVATQDPRLVRESRVSYGRLLGLLQFTLTFSSDARKGPEFRELVAAVALLTHISDASNHSNGSGIATRSDDGWTNHLWAAQRLLINYAPASLPSADRLDEGIMRHTLLNGLFLAVTKRRRWSVDTESFSNVEAILWTRLVRGFHPLPGLLEETDKALSEEAGSARMIDIVARLGDTRDRTSVLFPEVASPANIDPASMQNLDASAEEHVVMCESTAFPEMFAPMNREGSADAIKVVLSTILTLMLECTVLRIWHFRPDTLAATPRFTQRQMEHSAYLLARTLCKTSLSFTQHEKLTDVSTLRICLKLARNVFEQQSRFAEMGWCDACLIANQLRMQRIRPTAAPTLCKVEDLTAGIAEAGRYKSHFDARAFVVSPPQTPAMRLLQ